MVFLHDYRCCYCYHHPSCCFYHYCYDCSDPPRISWTPLNTQFAMVSFCALLSYMMNHSQPSLDMIKYDNDSIDHYAIYSLSKRWLYPPAIPWIYPREPPTGDPPVDRSTAPWTVTSTARTTPYWTLRCCPKALEWSRREPRAKRSVR